MLLDVAVTPAHHVRLERRELGAAVALEDERLRLVQLVDVWFAEAAAEPAPHEPLDFRGSSRTGGEERADARVRLVRAHAQTLELGDGKLPSLIPARRTAQRREYLTGAAPGQ